MSPFLTLRFPITRCSRQFEARGSRLAGCGRDPDFVQSGSNHGNFGRTVLQHKWNIRISLRWLRRRGDVMHVVRYVVAPYDHDAPFMFP